MATSALTSAIDIIKFVYCRSWQANSINVKGTIRDSITIMKLTKEQSADIKNQQSQSNSTKRVTVPELEKILYEACLLYTSPSPRDGLLSRMPSSA